MEVTAENEIKAGWIVSKPGAEETMTVVDVRSLTIALRTKDGVVEEHLRADLEEYGWIATPPAGTNTSAGNTASLAQGPTPPDAQAPPPDDAAAALEREMQAEVARIQEKYQKKMLDAMKKAKPLGQRRQEALETMDKLRDLVRAARGDVMMTDEDADAIIIQSFAELDGLKRRTNMHDSSLIQAIDREIGPPLSDSAGLLMTPFLFLAHFHLGAAILLAVSSAWLFAHGAVAPGTFVSIGAGVAILHWKVARSGIIE